MPVSLPASSAKVAAAAAAIPSPRAAGDADKTTAKHAKKSSKRSSKHKSKERSKDKDKDRDAGSGGKRGKDSDRKGSGKEKKSRKEKKSHKSKASTPPAAPAGPVQLSKFHDGAYDDSSEEDTTVARSVISGHVIQRKVEKSKYDVIEAEKRRALLKFYNAT